MEVDILNYMTMSMMTLADNYEAKEKTESMQEPAKRRQRYSKDVCIFETLRRKAHLIIN